MLVVLAMMISGLAGSGTVVAGVVVTGWLVAGVVASLFQLATMEISPTSSTSVSNAINILLLFRVPIFSSSLKIVSIFPIVS